MDYFEDIKRVLSGVLSLGARGNLLKPSTRLLGALPEFDSMAVVSVITAIEDNFGVIVDDDEVSAELFETVGSLHDFIAQKVDT